MGVEQSALKGSGDHAGAKLEANARNHTVAKEDLKRLHAARVLHFPRCRKSGRLCHQPGSLGQRAVDAEQLHAGEAEALLQLRTDLHGAPSLQRLGGDQDHGTRGHGSST